MSRTFSAPGKLVLVGEYAVLAGRPAIVAAVDRRARVLVEDAEELRIRGNEGSRWLRVTSTMSDADSDDHQLLAAVLREVQRRGMPLPRAHISVDTTDFSSDQKKLGLGSSAAAAVALASVFAHPWGTDVVHDVARVAHKAFQGGGSGVDVAASTYGGIVRFEGGNAAAAAALPKGLAVVVAWTGVPAKTQGFVDAFLALPDAEREALIARIDDATLRFTVGCKRSDVGEVVRAVGDAREAMRALGEAAGKDVVTREHRHIADLARAAGGQAKPSGAGGGDVAVCFVNESARAHLESTLEAAGFAVIPLAIGAPGARRDDVQPTPGPAQV